MNPSFQSTIADKPLIPGLFQIAAYANFPEAMPVRGNNSAPRRTLVFEDILNLEKMEAALRAIARKERLKTYRASAIRGGKKTLLNSGRF